MKLKLLPIEDKLVIAKEDIKELIFYLWDNFKDYSLKIERLKSEDFAFSFIYL
jgi:hypothetical protein